jgi:mono/diheme cytochrome c family protein
MARSALWRLTLSVSCAVAAAGSTLGASTIRGQPARLAQASGSDLRTFARIVAPFLETHCGSCHGPRRQRGELRLDTLDGDLAHGADRARWKEVYDRLSRGEMPPKTAPRPDLTELEPVVTWILGETRKLERLERANGGRARLRRLSRAEYANSIRDLLHVSFPFGDGPLDLLPPDGTADGFDKVGSALSIDPSLLAQYLSVAHRVADATIVSGPRPFETRRQRFEYEDTARSLAIGYECHQPAASCEQTQLSIMEGSVRTWDHLRLDPGLEATLPGRGTYTIRVRMSADLGARGEPLEVQLEWPFGKVLARWTLGKENARPRVFETTLPIDDAGKGREGPAVALLNGTTFYGFNEPSLALRNEAERAMNAANPVQAARLLALAKAEGGASTRLPNPVISDRARLPKLILDWIELEGPSLGQWPPRSHRELLFEGPGAKNDLTYARRVFERLLPRAYRRPVLAADLDAVLANVKRELDAGETFESAVKVGLEYVLCSPKFLYIIEPVAGPLDDYELASRLSYFLWSSLPDEELLRAATLGRLRAPGLLEAQVSRMLRDDRSRAFVDGFGAQWLQAARFVSVPPNRQIYRDWSSELEAAVKREPLAFFEEILRKDLSVLNFLTSDFAMLNAPLARHYGISGVQGDAFRRVALPREAHRGGLITQAAVLTIGSDGTRTLPVRRAAWILQTLFNSPPPPPPPNVREVEPNLGGAQLTVRERLVAHQKIPVCASCHLKIDPYGFALESYDAVGSWRTTQNGEDFGRDAPSIDASGVLPDGRRFRGSDEFRGLLAADAERFERALAEKMLTYALGRTVEADDVATLDGVVKAANANQGQPRMSAFITAIVKSAAFQAR